VHDLWMAATLGCLLQGLTVEEALLGITRHAGQAIGRPECGWLGEGSAADLALFRPPPGEPPDVAGLIQQMGTHRAVAVVRAGRRVL
jgi:imidazolonepropionase-like amidohydrolase